MKIKCIGPEIQGRESGNSTGSVWNQTITSLCWNLTVNERPSSLEPHDPDSSLKHFEDRLHKN